MTDTGGKERDGMVESLSKVRPEPLLQGKADEAVDYRASFHATAHLTLALTFLTDCQRVLNDIKTATPVGIDALLLYGASEEPERQREDRSRTDTCRGE